MAVATPPLTAQDASTQPAPTTQPASQTQPTPPQTSMPSSEAIEQQLLEQLENNPLATPNTSVGDQPSATGAPPSAGSVDVDPGVLGVAPGQDPPKLRREGEFVVSRRGRIVKSTNGRHVLFVFDADSDSAPEPPMVMTPCQMLQNMEDIVRERGNKITFVISGQVLVYRNVNYLLPTMMKIAIDRGNLKQ